MKKGNTLLLMLYLLFVWMSFLFVKVTDDIPRLLILMLLSLPVLLLLSSFLLRKAEGIRIPDPGAADPLRERKVFLFSALACLGILLIWYAAFFPGAFTEDSISQIEQAVSGEYSDWHPVWHTLLVFTLPLKLTGQAWTIVLLQILWFSLGTGCLCRIVFRLSDLRWTLFFLLFLLLNYYTGEILMFPWKDAAFAVSGALCPALGVSLLSEKDEAPKAWMKCAALGLLMSCATLFRHNGILFTGPLLLVLFFLLNKKQWLAVFGVCAAALFLIRVPLYSALGVSAPGSRVVETTGLPLTVLGNIAKEAPEKLDEETAGLMYGMASPEEWREKYQTGNFNSIKFTGISTGGVEEAGRVKILDMAFRNSLRAPKAALKALLALTDTVYGVETGIEGDTIPGIVRNNFGLARRGSDFLARLLLNIREAVRSSVFSRLTTIGFSIILLLIAVLSRLSGEARCRKPLLLALPLLVYDFGTMLLLSGPDSRFFFINYLTCPFLIVLILSERGQKLWTMEKPAQASSLPERPGESS